MTTRLARKKTTLFITPSTMSKKNKEKRMFADTYNKVLKHVRERARDGRYKNYEFLISLS